jgi:adapter protein MecA 1/2
MFELIMNEYGIKIAKVSFYEGYLNEYGEKVIENNALEILKEFY